MNKILRYSLVCLMAFLFGNVSAQELKTCADVIAGADGTTFRVKGECTKIANTTYGNWYLKDATGEIYIYGTLDAEGKTKNFSSLGIEVGDIVTVEGPKTTYKETTVELVDVTVISIEKASTPEPQPSGEVKKVSIADFNAAAESNDVWYQLTGTVKNLKDGDQYGNFDIEDETGSVYVYGLLSEKGGEKKKFQELAAEKGIKEGSKITIIGNRGSYKDKIEVMNAYFVSIAEDAAGLVWDFTKWSEATVAALKADAAASKTEGWSDVEKKADAESGADPTDISKDNCFWCVAEPNADGTLSANGVVIEELKGLVWNSEYTVQRSLAIAVNYPETSLGTYAGGSYLWLGSKNKVCFTIPNVAAGSVVTMEVESHKPAEGRGVFLTQNGTQIGEAFSPTTKESYSWTIENAGDVAVTNNQGCHIYKITVASASNVQAVKTIVVDNGYFYNLAGQRVDANYKGVVIKNGKKMIQK